jgi:hypothetical protein
MSNVVKFKDYLPPPPRRQRRKRQKSQYELYPLPFFNRKTRCTWDVKPTGDYVTDCETGKAYALEFLKSCDGTVGWTSLLPQIVSDMISAGPQEPPLPGGFQNPGGIVIGFMSVIGKAAAFPWLAHHSPAPAS